MDLAAGKRIGCYEVLAPIGAGGMGEVYRAKDTRLNREVAIKILPDAVARDPGALARFRREAQLLAALNHPNIASIYGIEESEGVHTLVLEFVPGETLAQRLEAGGLENEDALRYAIQIAQALEAAHEKGIIHRDLKPANIKITPEGKVKVLDFGLAKALGGGDAGQHSESPTITRRVTAEGQILGTPAYMSPEQARGRTLDVRTDVWSFGCVLYEMLAARRAFDGKTTADTIAAVVGRDPDWNALPANTPSGVESLLRRCLRRDFRERMHHAADIRILLEEARASSAAAMDAWKRITSESRWRNTSKAAALFLVGAMVAAVAMWIWMSVRIAPARLAGGRFSLVLPHRVQGPSFALSPDGSRLVYATGAGDTSQLYVRTLTGGNDRTIPGTEGGAQPFFSPDGQWVGFFARGRLKKVAMTGGTPVNLAELLGGGRGGSWGDDGTIVFSPGSRTGLTRVHAGGGATETFTVLNLDKGESSHRWPQFLPGSKWVIFSVIPSEGTEADYQIAAQSLETGERRVLIQGGVDARYVHSGHLVYANQGNLFAVPFDSAKLQITGPPRTVIEGVAHAGSDDRAIDGGGSEYEPGTQLWKAQAAVRKAIQKKRHRHQL